MSLQNYIAIGVGFCALRISIFIRGLLQLFGLMGAKIDVNVNRTSVAKWLAHLSFTSKVAGSNLNENFSV
jgi:hypothetical protein